MAAERAAAQLADVQRDAGEFAHLLSERDLSITRLEEALAQATEASSHELSTRDVAIRDLHTTIAKQASTASGLRDLIAQLESQLQAKPRPGQMKVHLSHASDLRAGDTDGVASSDAYMVVTLGGRTERTAVVERSLSPRFETDLFFGFVTAAAALAETSASTLALHASALTLRCHVVPLYRAIARCRVVLNRMAVRLSSPPPPPSRPRSLGLRHPHTR